MKILLKCSCICLIMLTACTEKKEAKLNEMGNSQPQVQEIDRLEKSTKQMDEKAMEIDKVAQELEEALDEIDN